MRRPSRAWLSTVPSASSQPSSTSTRFPAAARCRMSRSVFAALAFALVLMGAGCSSNVGPQTVPPVATSQPATTSTVLASNAEATEGTAPPPEPTVRPTDAQGQPRPTEPPISQVPESRVPVVTGPKSVPATDAPSGAKCTAEAVSKATTSDIPAGSQLEKLGCTRGYARAQYSGGLVAWLKAEGSQWVAVDVGVAELMVVPGPVPPDIQRELLGL